MLRTFLRRQADVRALKGSGLFDEAWYRERYLANLPGVDPIRHYVAHGQRLGLHPHPLFHRAWYLRHNTDVGAAGVDPFLHYATEGAREGRLPSRWATNPVAGLQRFLGEAVAGGTVGLVEMRTNAFVSGWISSQSEIESPQIVVGGRIGTATLFNPRLDVTNLIGRPAHGFLYSFDEPPAADEDVIVRFADGRMLHGSPYPRSGTALSPDHAIEPRADLSMHFDRLDARIARRLSDVAGWIRLGHGDARVDIRANGREQQVFFGLRTDVIAAFDDPFCVGFELTFDAADAVARGEEALDLEILVDGRLLERRRVPIALPPVREPACRLQLFMHIPKTAGISIGHAVKGLAETRSLWLYDRGKATIGAQLARLSPRALDDVDIVGGHFPYGLHRAIARPCDYVAFLREPAAYIKSFYLFMRYVARATDFAAGDVFAMVESRPEFDNAFVRWFAEVPQDRRVEAADLDRALATMERDFVFVGLLERMEESMARLSALWGAELPVLQENKTPPVAEAATIDLREIARRAPQAIRYDAVLHARAQALFWS